MANGEAFILGLVTGMLATALSVTAIITTSWREEAIAHGAAQYNSKTGIFEWKDTVKPKVEKGTP
jgi:hypothetical protein